MHVSRFAGLTLTTTERGGGCRPTTIYLGELPEDLHYRAKVRAVTERLPLKDLFVKALEEYLKKLRDKSDAAAGTWTDRRELTWTELGAILTDHKHGQEDINDSVYANLRAGMWVACRDWLTESGSIPDDQELMNDLTTPMYSFDARNRYQIERKSDIKKAGRPSPDCAEALIHTFVYPGPQERRL